MAESTHLPDGAPEKGASGQWHSGLQALEQSIREFMESIRELRVPLADSKEALPEATTQLDRISEQTEKATHQVMDRVESIGSNQTELIALLNEALNMISDGKLDGAALAEKLTHAEEIANRTQNDAFVIMDALQFQDITTQQMNHAASLLEEVEAKITEIIGGMDPENAAALAEHARERKKRAFDPHADMERRHTDQTGVDDIVSMTLEKKNQSE
ncbi:MAG TPA: protein phosphatase CheZ, partial [candidate division Zixibacteria bacterium]|nr:protein phosphatase CheZ [candidate division Zixibacteria bacterium]